jgi:molybdopterin converting factor subunit 1
MTTSPTQLPTQIQRTAIELMQGDITELTVDAIVNAANSALVLGAGVAGAIRRSGGPAIQAECDTLGPIATGQAVLTGAGALKARHVIHAVGPRWTAGEGEEEAEELLAQATRRSLELAEAKGLRSLAFPAISTGVYGFPIERCAEIMLGTTLAFIAPGSHLERIVFCLFGDQALRVFERELAALGGEGEDARAAGAHAQISAGNDVQIAVRFFAATREAVGVEVMTLAFPPGATAGQALAALVTRHPSLAGHAGSLRLAVNRTYVGAEHLLRDGDELALIPPTCGG